MYVRDIMMTEAVTARPEECAVDIARMMADNHVNSVFIVEGEVLLGRISQRDLLRELFPTYQEFYDDLVHNSDFEAMEKRVQELSSRTARDVMQPVGITVTPDMPVMKVAAWMVLRDISAVPVLGGEGKFLGVVSRGDIFDQTIRGQLGDASAQKRTDTKVPDSLSQHIM